MASAAMLRPEVGSIQWEHGALSVRVEWLQIANTLLNRICRQSLGYLEQCLYCSVRFHDAMLC